MQITVRCSSVSIWPSDTSGVIVAMEIADCRELLNQLSVEDAEEILKSSEKAVDNG